MFTDMVDSVALQQRVGTAAYADVITVHDQIFHQALADSEDGEILSHTGDGMMMRFSDPSDAVDTALRLQLIASQTLVEGKPFRIRIGMHLGMITEMADKVGGDPRLVGMVLNLAARVMDSGDAGQILVTRAIFDDARQCVRLYPPVEGCADLPPVVWMVHGDYLFKGSDEPLAIFEVGAEGIAPLKAPGDGKKCRKVPGTGSQEVIPSLPPPPSMRPNLPEGKPAKEEIESQRGEFERAHDELQAEIARLRQSEEEESREVEREAEFLEKERQRIDQAAVELAETKAREEGAARELLEKARLELEDAIAEKQRIDEDLEARKLSFERQLQQRGDELDESVLRRRQELEARARELADREALIAEKNDEGASQRLESERAALTAERERFQSEIESMRARMEDERRSFSQQQEEERLELLRVQQEAKLESEAQARQREKHHAEALEKLHSVLAKQEAELEQQRVELAAGEERIVSLQAGGDVAHGSRVDQLGREANEFAARISELNEALERANVQQKRRLIKIGVGSVVLALVVGIFSAKLIWGFYPWKLLTAAPEVQSNLVIEGLKRLEASGDWKGVLGATIGAESQMGEDPGEREEVLGYARLAVQKLAAPPWGDWGDDADEVLGILEQAGKRGWDLPPEFGFLISSLEISRARRSDRGAGIPRAIGAFLDYQNDAAGAAHSAELDRQFGVLLDELSERIDRDVALADEDAIQNALADFPEGVLERIGDVSLVWGKMQIRDQLRSRPRDLSGALAILQGCATEDAAWKRALASLFGEVLDGIREESGELPSPEVLQDLGVKWEDPRPLVIALNRLPDGGGRGSALLKLSELYKKERTGERAEGGVAFSDDALAWVGYACVSGDKSDEVDPVFGTAEQRRAEGVKILRSVAENGGAKAKYFLVRYQEAALRDMVAGKITPSAVELDAWQVLAEGAISGGEPDALYTLGLIHHARAVLAGEEHQDYSRSIRRARMYYARAEVEARESIARDHASHSHANTWRRVPPEGGETAGCAGSFFRAGCVYWNIEQRELAKTYWEKAWKIDQATATLEAQGRLREERAGGSREQALADALEDWLEDKR